MARSSQFCLSLPTKTIGVSERVTLAGHLPLESQSERAKRRDMATPCIYINSDELGQFLWALVVDDAKCEGSAGHSTIAACLKAAIAALPLNRLFVEIMYRGVHMGAFNVCELAERPDLVADHIVETHALNT